MITQCAAEAECMVVATPNCRDDSHKVSLLDGALDGIFTIGTRTPLEIVLVVDIGSCQKDVISSLHLVIA